MTGFGLTAIIAGLALAGAAQTGGVRVATGDVNGDGVADIVTGAGAGGSTQMRVVDGKTGKPIMAFDPKFLGGVSVVVQDTNGDGRADIVVTAGDGDPSAAGHVKVFSGKDGSLLTSSAAPGRGRRN